MLRCLPTVPMPVVDATDAALQRAPFYVPLALPGDDITPQRFFDRQGAVHARVSVDFARESGCLLEARL